MPLEYRDNNLTSYGREGKAKQQNWQKESLLKYTHIQTKRTKQIWKGELFKLVFIGSAS